MYSTYGYHTCMRVYINLWGEVYVYANRYMQYINFIYILYIYI